MHHILSFHMSVDAWVAVLHCFLQVFSIQIMFYSIVISLPLCPNRNHLITHLFVRKFLKSRKIIKTIIYIRNLFLWEVIHTLSQSLVSKEIRK